VHLDQTGACDLVASVMPASAWVQAWAVLRTQLRQLGVLDHAHVSLFIVSEDGDQAEEDRVLWVGCNVGDA
jgi:hypothetical protein